MTGLGFVPTASASPVPGSPIPAGANVTVFHNLDFIATSGWGAGELLTIEVLRNDVVIGSVRAPAIVGPEGVGLEVNHGPEGVPVDGDCWEGYTPDIRPLDTIRITHSGGVSAVVVDNITFSGDAVEEAPVPPAVEPDVVVRGVAKFADGTNIPIAALDSAEFRDGQLRGAPTSVEVDPVVEGGFIMRYEFPYTMDRNRDNLSPAQIRTSLLNSGGHAIGFGHVDPLPAESMLVDGTAEAPGPAPGCEAAPTATRAIGSVSPSVINLGNPTSGVTVSGISDSADVDVTLSDGADSVTQTVSATGGTWTAQFDATQLQALEGTITASASTAAGAAVNTGTLVKDLVAPSAPTVSPNGGAITGQRSVFIAGAAGDTLRYTVGNGSQAAPTASSGTVFSGPFNVAPGQTVKAIAVDAAGNASSVTTSAFTQAVTPPVVTPPVVTPPSGGSAAIIPLAPGIGQAKSGKRGGNDTATAKWRAPVANGAVLSGYEVRALKLRPGRSAKIRPSVAVGSTVSKLRMSLPAGKYKFRVRAVSAAGKSPWSERSATVRSR